jgi:hypothetical protein
MKNWTIVAFSLAALLVALHVEVIYRSNSTSRDTNGYDSMVAFFCGVPLAIATVGVSFTALNKTKNKRFIIPVILGLIPILGWPLIFVLESFSIIP